MCEICSWECLALWDATTCTYVCMYIHTNIRTYVAYWHTTRCVNYCGMPGLSEAIPYICECIVHPVQQALLLYCLHTYILMYVRMYISMHVHMYVCVCIHLLECRTLCDCTKSGCLPHVRISVCVHIYVHMQCMYLCIFLYSTCIVPMYTVNQDQPLYIRTSHGA